jgi:hypothetical protein
LVDHRRVRQLLSDRSQKVWLRNALLNDQIVARVKRSLFESWLSTRRQQYLSRERFVCCDRSLAMDKIGDQKAANENCGNGDI